MVFLRFDYQDNTGFGLLVGIVISAFQLINLLSKSRATLKTDIEIFKLLKPADPGYEQIKKHVGESIAAIYTDSLKTNVLGIKIYNWGDFIFGMFFVLIFPILTFYLWRSGYNIWAIVTGFLAVGGLGGILNGLDPKNAPPEDNNPPPNPKT